jgi:hypothetical protein
MSRQLCGLLLYANHQGKERTCPFYFIAQNNNTITILSSIHSNISIVSLVSFLIFSIIYVTVNLGGIKPRFRHPPAS